MLIEQQHDHNNSHNWCVLENSVCVDICELSVLGPLFLMQVIQVRKTTLFVADFMQNLAQLHFHAAEQEKLQLLIQVASVSMPFMAHAVVCRQFHYQNTNSLSADGPKIVFWQK